MVVVLFLKTSDTHNYFSYPEPWNGSIICKVNAELRQIYQKCFIACLRPVSGIVVYPTYSKLQFLHDSRDTKFCKRHDTFSQE